MKLMVCIIKKQYSGNLIKQLGEKGYRVTRLASTGGLLKKGNDTLLIGVRNEAIEQLQDEMKQIIQAIEKEKGWKTEESRYTSFVIKAQNFLPIFSTKE